MNYPPIIEIYNVNFWCHFHNVTIIWCLDYINIYEFYKFSFVTVDRAVIRDISWHIYLRFHQEEKQRLPLLNVPLSRSILLK